MVPGSKATSCHRDERNLFFLWVKSTVLHKWSPQLSSGIEMNLHNKQGCQTFLLTDWLLHTLRTCMGFVVFAFLCHWEFLFCPCNLWVDYLWCLSTPIQLSNISVLHLGRSLMGRQEILFFESYFLKTFSFLSQEMAVHVYNPSTSEMVTKRSGVQGQIWLHSESEVIMIYERDSAFIDLGLRRIA